MVASSSCFDARVSQQLVFLGVVVSLKALPVTNNPTCSILCLDYVPEGCPKDLFRWMFDISVYDVM